MRCKQAEKLLIEAAQIDLAPVIKTKLDAHILSCPKCASFSKNFEMIREGIENIKTPGPTMELLKMTGVLCHNELIEQAEAVISESSHRLTTKTPRLVWAALGAFVILTIVWAFPILKNLATDQTITQQTIVVIAIIIQNLIMLLFVPILFRSLKLYRLRVRI